MIRVIAAQQMLVLRRQRMFITLLVTLLVMSATAGVLGWSSHHTILGVYVEAVALLTSNGHPAPPNPFLLKPPLSLLSNMVIYIPLIGALLALLLGHLSIGDDEASGVGRLVFSRPVPRSSYVIGKLASAAVVLTAVMASSMIISALSLVVVNRVFPTVDEFGRLALFYSLSWLYLMAFFLIGMLAVLVAHRRSLALLSAMGAWLVITFVVPQLTSGLRPTASLNPIVTPVGTSQLFFRVTAYARPFSVVEQYKAASGSILQTVVGEPGWHTIGRVAPIMCLLILLAIAAVVLVQRHDFSRGASGE